MANPNSNLYMSPIATDVPITIYSVTNAFSQAISDIIAGAGGGSVIDVTGTLTANGQELSLTENTQYTPQSGVLTIVYNSVVTISTPTGGPATPNFTATYTIQVVSNVDPLPKWNARTVIERALAIAETIREGDAPRFTLNAEQADLL